MEPGQELRALEQAILRQDVGLEAPTLKRSVLQQSRWQRSRGRRSHSPSARGSEDRDRPVLRRRRLDRRWRSRPTRRYCGRSLARYFERMKAIVEHHGGTVEKFIGDAVMAVFGVPLAHEDDALRACRAAVEMREAFPGTRARGPDRHHHGRGRYRHGGAPRHRRRGQRRSSPAADGAAGGGASRRSPPSSWCCKAVEVEALEPLALKGKAQPVEASRLLAVHDAPERRHEARFVGRERELAAIREAWERALTEQRCELVTIIGEAGVGKSRLVAEALASMDARTSRVVACPTARGSPTGRWSRSSSSSMCVPLTRRRLGDQRPARQVGGGRRRRRDRLGVSQAA